ncbi:hypothetical protein GT025_23990 [Streptomyces sp. SID4920]|nr:hypothetical protein [Streptomyces sp. SID4920]MYX64166.1 hypothetical protein [Streptomyces sp. SID8373]
MPSPHQGPKKHQSTTPHRDRADDGQRRPLERRQGTASAGDRAARREQGDHDPGGDDGQHGGEERVGEHHADQDVGPVRGFHADEHVTSRATAPTVYATFVTGTVRTSASSTVCPGPLLRSADLAAPSLSAPELPSSPFSAVRSTMPTVGRR